MYPKFKTNLIGVAVALSFVLIGFGLGEPPRLAVDGAAPTFEQVGLQAVADPAPRAIRHAALVRQLAMPYVSFAALSPRREG
jgi:hypothetical protein